MREASKEKSELKACSFQPNAARRKGASGAGASGSGPKATPIWDRLNRDRRAALRRRDQAKEQEELKGCSFQPNAKAKKKKKKKKKASAAAGGGKGAARPVWERLHAQKGRNEVAKEREKERQANELTGPSRVCRALPQTVTARTHGVAQPRTGFSWPRVAFKHSKVLFIYIAIDINIHYHWIYVFFR